MRTITVTEKYRAVQEGTMSKNEFVRQMRQEYPMYVSNFDGFDSTVSILKTRNMLFEAPKKAFENVKVYDDRPALTYSLDALHRGIRAELGKNNNPTSEEFIAAEKKAKDNLEKDANHYLNLMSGESNKVDKHDKEKEVKRGAADKDTFNDMKKATLKEGMYIDDEEEEMPINTDADFEREQRDQIAGRNESMSLEEKKDIMVQVVDALRAKYPEITGSILKDFIRTHYEDIIGGADIEGEFEEYIYANYETAADFRDVDEKKGKDHDGDGDIDGDDYMAAKDKAIKKAMGKEEQLKEAIKSIIKKTLNEDMINEAATNELARIADDYAGFEGMKSAILDLQNVVSDIEAYYDKTRDKIQKVYDRLGEIRNEEGLKVGGFLAPAIESAFLKDLRPVTKTGFTKGLDTPKVKTISSAEIDAARAAGEIEEEPKHTMFTPVNEINFGKKEIIDNVSFPNGVKFKVGEYSDDYGMKVVAIRPVPENEREEDEVVYVNMEDGPDGISVPFNANGEEVEI